MFTPIGRQLWKPAQNMNQKRTTPQARSVSMLDRIFEIISKICHCKNNVSGTSLVANWLRIHLPMQGTQVRALVWEDPTCRGATKPVRHNYWACALEPTSHNYWARMPQLWKPARPEPVLRNEKPPQWEARAPQWRVAPLATTRESSRAATKTQRSQK